MDEPIVYQLKTPIVVTKKGGGEALRVEQLELRTPKAKDLRALDRESGEVGKSLALIAALSGQPPFVLDEMSVEDFQAVGELVGAFFPDGQETGTTS